MTTYVERGYLRSGGRLAARNTPHFTSLKELYSRHKRLLASEPAVTTQEYTIQAAANARVGSLLRTTVRFRTDYPDIAGELRTVFQELFREHSHGPDDGFEVVVTFNAILTNSDQTTFSVFYGHDFSVGNSSGARAELRYGSSIVVKSMYELHKIPTSFNYHQLAVNHRHSFHASDVKVLRFINVVYLVSRYLEFQQQASRRWRSPRRQLLRRRRPPMKRSRQAENLNP